MSATGRANVCVSPHAAPARPALHRGSDRRTGRDHPGRPGDRRLVDRRAPGRRLAVRIVAHAPPGPRDVAALQRGGPGRARARARGARRGAGHLRRRAAAHARLHHRHPRPGPAAAAQPGDRARRPHAAARPPHGRLGHAHARARRLRRRGHRRRRGPRAHPAAPGGAVIDAAAEHARRPTGPGFADAVTFSFADPAEALYGLARLVLWGDGGGSLLAVLFAGGEPVAQVFQRSVPVGGSGSEGLAIDGLEATIEQPLERWTIRFDDGEHGFALTFEAAGPPAELDAGEPAARAGELPGYEQLCHVHGTVRLGAETREVRCRGQRGHSWGVPDFDGVASWRMLGAWLEDGTGVVLRAVRPAGAAHGEEANWAAVIGSGGSLRVDDPRLSTTYD